MTGNLLLFARDPGNANQIVALHALIWARLAGEHLEAPSETCARLVADLAAGRDESSLLVVGSGAGVQVLEAAGVGCTRGLAEQAVRDPAAMLREHRVDTVVTGLSDRDDRTPQALWQAAHSCGAQSIALADDTILATKHARNDLNERFRDRDGENVFPDLLYLVDEATCNAVSAVGVPTDAVRVIGNLHLHRFRRLARAIDRDRLGAIRREWGATNANKVVLYASEPITQMRKHGKIRDHDELSYLAKLCEQIRTNTSRPGIPCGPETMVVVRPHPRDDVEKFEPFLSDSEPRTIVSRAGTSAEAILAADAVVGITSMLLVEAAALDRPSVSLIDFDPQAAARGA